MDIPTQDNLNLDKEFFHKKIATDEFIIKSN